MSSSDSKAITHNKRTARNEIDMIHGGLAGKIMLFALPIAAASILQQLFNSADTAVVGHFVSSEAQAAVGANSAVINLLVNTFVGISVGANVVIAALAARKEEERIHRAVHTVIAFSLLVSAGIFLVGELLAAPILRLMATPEDVMDLAAWYLRLYLLGVPFEMVYNFGSAVLRSKGDSKRPLLALFFSGVLNVAMNLFFVVALHRSVDGVAVATVLSNAVAAGLVLHFLAKEEDAFRFRWKDLCLDRDLLSRVVQIGFPAGLQGAVFSVSNMCIQSAINSFGSRAVAGASIATYFDLFTYYFSGGMAQACLTFASQNHAVGREKRCTAVFRDSILLGLLLTFSAGMVFYFGRTMFLGFYTKDAVVLAFAVSKMRHSMVTQFLEVPFDMPGSMLRSYDHPLAPAVITVIGTCVFRLGWVFLVFPHDRDYARLMNVYPISWILTDILMLVTWAIVRRNWNRKHPGYGKTQAEKGNLTAAS